MMLYAKVKENKKSALQWEKELLPPGTLYKILNTSKCGCIIEIPESLLSILAGGQFYKSEVSAEFESVWNFPRVGSLIMVTGWLGHGGLVARHLN